MTGVLEKKKKVTVKRPQSEKSVSISQYKGGGEEGEISSGGFLLNFNARGIYLNEKYIMYPVSRSVKQRRPPVF